MRRVTWALFVCAAAPLAVAATSAPAAEAQIGEGVDVAPVVVLGATPLGKLDAQTADAPIQAASASEIERSHALDLSAFLTRKFRGVYVNDIQNNPLQADLNYRGFTASPLLGTPQGLSVYVDGMRFNQPFGDVVSWDLLPRQAIETVALVPGSNPLFGLNTLGGAITVRTRDGRTHPGGSVQLEYGSYDRRFGALDYGDTVGPFDAYVSLTGFKEDGWREDSPSNALQAFSKLGWTAGATRLALSGAFAHTDLHGNGLQEQRFLSANRASVYTKPDVTQNESGFGNLVFEHEFGETLSLTGNAYYREIRTRTYNGDINDESLTETLYQPNAAERAALVTAGITGFPLSGETAANTPFPKFRCIANVLLNSEPGEKCNGLVNRSHTRQHDAGVAAQVRYTGTIGDLNHVVVAGAALREGRARFRQSSQYGYLTPDRGIVAVDGPGAFADGSQDSEEPRDARVDLIGRTRSLSAFVTDTLDISPSVVLAASLRVDNDRIRNSDGITPGGGPGSLDGRLDFSRANGAFGATWTVSEFVTADFSISRGGRAPSVIELGCADPDNPCRLPNALAGDPPLKQVRTTTLEAGVRGVVSGVSWNARLFRADNRDDILFVADDISGFGYFRNFGRTRRQGAEVGAEGRWGGLSVGASYTFLEAVYRSPEVVGGSGNSTNDIGPGFEGRIYVEPGDRIPLTPKHLFKASLDWSPTSALDLGVDVLASSGVYARGNENNAHAPDGVFYLGPGRTKGYAVVNAGAAWRPAPKLELFVQISNLLDKTYATSAQLGATGFTDAGAFIARPFSSPVIDGERPVRAATFYGPGAPRMVSVGLKYRLGGGSL